jgi:hypothetical protein
MNMTKIYWRKIKRNNTIWRRENLGKRQIVLEIL